MDKQPENRNSADARAAAFVDDLKRTREWSAIEDRLHSLQAEYEAANKAFQIAAKHAADATAYAEALFARSVEIFTDFEAVLDDARARGFGTPPGVSTH